MVVYFYDQSKALIATATDLRLTTMNLQMKYRPLQLDNSGRLMQSPPDGVINPEVHLTDWNPQPPVPSAPDVFSPADIRLYKTMLASVVHMMGGAVTISDTELTIARSLDIDIRRDEMYRTFLEVKYA